MKSAADDPEAAAEGVLPLKVSPAHHEIVNYLALLGYGEFLGTLADARLDLEKAISEAGKAGEITIKIKTVPDGHHKRVITFDVKIKKPVMAARNTYVFATEQGQYVENDPEQRQLPLNVTDIRQPAPRVVNQ